MKELDETIMGLLAKIRETKDALEAEALSRAVLNLANTYAITKSAK